MAKLYACHNEIVSKHPLEYTGIISHGLAPGAVLDLELKVWRIGQGVSNTLNKIYFDKAWSRSFCWTKYHRYNVIQCNNCNCAEHVNKSDRIKSNFNFTMTSHTSPSRASYGMFIANASGKVWLKSLSALHFYLCDDYIKCIFLVNRIFHDSLRYIIQHGK